MFLLWKVIISYILLCLKKHQIHRLASSSLGDISWNGLFSSHDMLCRVDDARGRLSFHLYYE